MPVIILAATFLLYRERPRALQVLGVLVSVIGVFVIATKGSWRAFIQLTFNTGDLWVLAAVGAYALYSALLRKRPAVSPLSFLAATFGIGVLILLPLYIHEHLTIAHVQPTLVSYLAIAYVSVFPGFLSYLIYNRRRAGRCEHCRPLHAPDADLR
jgi:drug/metabolite transporter (DMT)-like permease